MTSSDARGYFVSFCSDPRVLIANTGSVDPPNGRLLVLAAVAGEKRTGKHNTASMNCAVAAYSKFQEAAVAPVRRPGSAHHVRHPAVQTGLRNDYFERTRSPRSICSLAKALTRSKTAVVYVDPLCPVVGRGRHFARCPPIPDQIDP